MYRKIVHLIFVKMSTKKDKQPKHFRGKMQQLAGNFKQIKLWHFLFLDLDLAN
jgi:hypothetical protein